MYFISFVRSFFAFLSFLFFHFILWKKILLKRNMYFLFSIFFTTNSDENGKFWQSWKASIEMERLLRWSIEPVSFQLFDLVIYHSFYITFYFVNLFIFMHFKAFLNIKSFFVYKQIIGNGRTVERFCSDFLSFIFGVRDLGSAGIKLKIRLALAFLWMLYFNLAAKISRFTYNQWCEPKWNWE